MKAKKAMPKKMGKVIPKPTAKAQYMKPKGK